MLAKENGNGKCFASFQHEISETIKPRGSLDSVEEGSKEEMKHVHRILYMLTKNAETDTSF